MSNRKHVVLFDFKNNPDDHSDHEFVVLYKGCGYLKVLGYVNTFSGLNKGHAEYIMTLEMAKEKFEFVTAGGCHQQF